MDALVITCFLQLTARRPRHTFVDCLFGGQLISTVICEECKYVSVYPFERWNRILKAFANSLDPDETPQNVASHQDPNCLLF